MKTDLEKSVFSYVNKKIVLLQQYLSVTAELVDALKQKKSWESERFLLRRQSLIQGIDALDRSFDIRTGPSSQKPADLSEAQRESVRESLEAMHRVLAAVRSKDGELNVLAEEESESLKRELLGMRARRSAAHGYGNTERGEPRFLDVRK